MDKKNSIPIIQIIGHPGCGRDPLFNKIPHVKAFITDSSVSASDSKKVSSVFSF